MSTHKYRSLVIAALPRSVLWSVAPERGELSIRQNRTQAAAAFEPLRRCAAGAPAAPPRPPPPHPPPPPTHTPTQTLTRTRRLLLAYFFVCSFVWIGWVWSRSYQCSHTVCFAQDQLEALTALPRDTAVDSLRLPSLASALKVIECCPLSTHRPTVATLLGGRTARE